MTIDNYNFKGKKAFVRVDFNVPVDENFVITDDTRIRAAMPTLKHIVENGGRLIMASHMGRPKKNPDPKYSLKCILPRVSELLGVEVKFAEDCNQADEICASLKDGEAVLLENLRFYAEEEGKPRGLAEDASDEEKAAAKKAIKAAQKEFAKHLASYADCYVNDAFGTAHRAHASTAVMASSFDKDNKMFGFLMEKEVKAVEKVMANPARPFTAIMGGSKVSTKIEIIENLLTKVDNLIIVGAMTYTFIKAQGGMIGDSLHEDDKMDLSLELLKKAEKNGVKMYLPVDNVIADKFDNNAHRQTTEIHNVPNGWIGMDIAEMSERVFADVIKSSKTVLWNGPAGVFEMENFAHGSKALAQAVADATQLGAYSLVGGGDSVACINKFGLADKVSYVSTGGGALLEAIEGKVLPGIAAIND
ncbi:MAG: phosphoglycerate kinase [Paludibacteraceae bacterium]|nr:phosphoglycerate kinase [Paludibacteraceae bacterium]